MGLVPGAVLFAASFAQRPAPVTRSIGGAFAWPASPRRRARLGRGPPDRPARAAGDHLPRRPRAAVTPPSWCSAPPTSSATRTSAAVPLPLEPPGPRPRRRPRHPRRHCLQRRAADLGRGGRHSVVDWHLDFTTAQAVLDADYDEVGKGRQVHDLPASRSMSRRVLAVAAYAVALRALVLAGRHPQRPDRRRAVALAARDLLAAGLVVAVPEGLVAVAGALAFYGLARGMTDDWGFARTRAGRSGPTSGWPGCGVATGADRQPPAPALRRPVRWLRPRCTGTTTATSASTPRTSSSGSRWPACCGSATAAGGCGGSGAT